MKIDPRYTSQKCSKCGHIERANRTGSIFKCKKCKYELHSDLNASINITNLGKADISRLSVNQPIVVASANNKVINSLVTH